MEFISIASKACRFLSACLFICLLPAVTAGYQHQVGYAEQIIETARIRQISEQRAWRLLLHYPEKSGGMSKIDDAFFFLASDGRHAPEAELVATVQGLFLPAEQGDKHPRCRFPARYDWLREQLAIDDTRLPQPVCAEQNEYLERINPRSASLMFPSAYMNSPASMFGHTFIRIDSEKDSELLSFAVNYAAQTDEVNGMVYAMKGVFGLYKGYFSIMPQYVKIREYSNLEHRDIWEYRLNLTPDEVRRMTLHLWELRSIYSHYYFFDKNCSYNLLFLIENARPSVHLTDKTPPWVVPLDTISLIRSAGLISSTGYRPSQGQKIRAITHLMDSSDIKRGQSTAGQEKSFVQNAVDLPPERAIKVLDLATELLQFSYEKRRISQDDYRKQLLSLLRDRSRLSTPQVDPYLIEKPLQPDKGHASARTTLGGGFDRGKPFIEAGIRPAYHSLNDPGDGYVEGAQIQFMDTSFRYYPRQEHARLERFALLDIVSLSDFERIFRRTSWKVMVGMDQVQKKQGNDVMAFRLNTGAGIALDAGMLGMFYGLSEIEANVGQGLRDWYAVGAGGSVGLLSRIGNRIKLHLNGKTMWYPFGEERVSLRGESVSGISISQNNSFDAILRYTDTSGQGKSESLILWNHFF